MISDAGADAPRGAEAPRKQLLPARQQIDMYSFFSGVILASFTILSGMLVASALLPLGRRGSAAEPEVDFHFQMLNISTPRQGGKSLNLFIKFRYPHSAEQCPFSAVDNNCIQYQKGMRELALNLTRDGTDGTFYPELGAEWERVNLALCRAIYAGAYGPTAQPIAAVSTLLQVNGDGRPYSERGPTMPFEPDAHGTTCTIGDIPPVQRPNHLPNLGGLVELRASAEGVYSN